MEKINYEEIANIAIKVLDSAMSEKTGSELQTIFNLGQEAFDKIKAAAMLAASMMERIVTGEDSRGIIDDFTELVKRGVTEYSSENE